jgi:maleate isomerase
LALNKALELWGIKKLGLITPYQEDVQMKIMENYAAIGVVIEEGMEKHLGVVKNTDIAEIGEKVLDELVKDVVGNRVDAVTTFCTNPVAAQRVDFWEKEHGIPVFDTVATVIWDMLTKCGVDARGLNGWGMIFQKG